VGITTVGLAANVDVGVGEAGEATGEGTVVRSGPPFSSPHASTNRILRIAIIITKVLNTGPLSATAYSSLPF
jgi:hypothetical protein